MLYIEGVHVVIYCISYGYVSNIIKIKHGLHGRSVSLTQFRRHIKASAFPPPVLRVDL